MEKKLLRKRKGQWVTLSMSVLASSLLVVNSVQTIIAAEGADSQVTDPSLELEADKDKLEDEEDRALQSEHVELAYQEELEQDSQEVIEESEISEPLDLDNEELIEASDLIDNESIIEEEITDDLINHEFVSEELQEEHTELTDIVDEPVAIVETTDEWVDEKTEADTSLLEDNVLETDIAIESEAIVETTDEWIDDESEEDLNLQEEQSISASVENIQVEENSEDFNQTKTQIEVKVFQYAHTPYALVDSDSHRGTSAGTKRGKTYQFSDQLTTGPHHKNLSEEEIIANIVAAEALNTPESIRGVVSTIYNRADKNGTTPYQEAIKSHQFSGYGGGSVNARPWKRHKNSPKTEIKKALAEANDGYRTHDFTHFLASGYFYDDGTWNGARNKAGESLEKYVTAKKDIGGNTYFDPGSNFPWKSSKDLAKERQEAVNTVTVNRGDTLYRIARDNGTTVSELRRLNNLSGDIIHPGQVVKVSTSTTVTRPAVTTPTTNPSSSQSATTTGTTTTTPAQTVTVNRGDTLYRIARDNGMTVAELRRLNNLTGDIIHPGQVVKVSAGTTATRPVTSSPSRSTSNQPGTSSTSAGTSAKTVTVNRGDSLYRIARDNGTTVSELRRLNNLTGDLIHPGQVVKVSAGTAATRPVTPSPSRSTSNQPDAPSTSAETSAKTVTVNRGDSLYRIARDNGTTVAELRRLNNLTGDIIHPGQVVKVSAGTTATGATKPASRPSTNQTTKPSTSTPSTSPAKTVTVNRGDTLYRIARANGITVSELRRLNNLSGDVIHPGQVIKLSAGSGNSSQASNSNTGSVVPFTGNNLPDLTNVQGRVVNYDVKLNGKVEPFRRTLGTQSQPVSVLTHFGDRFQVTREFNTNGNTFLELSQNGVVQGYVPKSAAVQVPQNVRTVYIDAGHGGRETGAYSFGTAEKDLNLNITRQLSDLLRGKGYHVYESRTTDKYIDLRERQNEPNALMPDVYISVHHNAMPNPGTAQGIVTLYHDPSIDEPGYRTLSHHHGTDIIPEGKRLAQALQTHLVRQTGANNQGTRAQNLHVTRTTDVPAALVELGFQDHWGEFQKLTNKSYQNKLINGLINGIDAYFAGIK